MPHGTLPLRAGRKILDMLLAEGQLSDRSGRLAGSLADRLNEPRPTISQTFRRLEERGLIEREINGKRTFRIVLTSEGKKMASNPYYALSSEEAVRLWLKRDAPYGRWEAAPGKLGTEIADLIDNGAGGWVGDVIVSAIRNLEDTGKVIVGRKTAGGYPISVELKLPESEPEPESESEPEPDVADVVEPEPDVVEPEPDSDSPKANLKCVCHYEPPERCPVHHGQPQDPLDYDELAKSLLAQVMEQAAHPPVVVDEGAQQELAATKATLRRLEGELETHRGRTNQLQREHDDLLKKYNRAIRERNDAVQALQLTRTQKRSNNVKVVEQLSPESRANLERLMKDLPGVRT